MLMKYPLLHNLFALNVSLKKVALFKKIDRLDGVQSKDLHLSNG